MRKTLLLAALMLAYGAPAGAGNRGSQGSAPSVGAALGGAPGAAVSIPALPASSLSVPGASGLPGVNTGLPASAIPSGAPAVSASSNDPAGKGVPGAPEGARSGPNRQQGADAARPNDASQDPASADQTATGRGAEAAPEAVPAAEGEESRRGPQAGPSLSAESQKTRSDARFDGSRAKTEGPSVAAPKGFFGGLFSRLKPSGPKEPKVKTAFDRDAYGGPQSVKLTGGQKVKEGLRWGLTLTGVATLIQLGLGALFSRYPWQLNVSKEFLEGTGRVELMTGMGPHSIAEAVMTNPVFFFMFQMPLMTAKEEIVYRGIQFALIFFFVAALKPAAAVVSRFLDNVPDLFSLRSVTKRGLDLVGRVSGRAFGIAAVLTAWTFAVAHFNAWGFEPVAIAVHATLGYALAYLAYKTRSLTTAFVAHFTYNALSVAGLLVLMAAGVPAAMIYSLGLGVVSVTAAFLHWRSYRKAKGLAVAQAKLSLRGGLAGLVIAAFLAASLSGLAPKQNAVERAAAGPKAPAGWVMPVQQAEPQQPAPADPKAAPDAQGQQTAPDTLKAPEDSLPPEIRQAFLDLQKKLGIVQAEQAPKVLQPLAAVTARGKESTVMVINPGNGLGTGFVISKDGLLLTNAHVVAGAENATVIIKFENGLQGPAKIVAVNHDKDIALIQLPKNPEGDWKALEITPGDTLSEGDQVLALGHPRGLPFTVTQGIISGIGSRGNYYVEHFQTDAAINPGNSGGPLIDAKTGKVVGMNTQIITADGGSNGLGFAITAKSLQDAVDQYRATGNINSSWLGIIVNVSGENDGEPGVLIEAVRPGSPAAAAGLIPGDVILGANGKTFSDPETAVEQLGAVIAKSKPGAPLVIALARYGDITLHHIALADKK